MYVPQFSRCPIEKLPSPFLEAVVDVCKRTGAPPETVTADTFALASTVTQQSFKLLGFNGSYMPTTLNTLSLAPPATGKGESYKTFFKLPSDLDTVDSNHPSTKMAINDMLLDDESFSSLMDHLHGKCRSAAIQLEDGYSFLYSPLMKPGVMSKLTQIWSGPPSIKLGRHRSSKEAVEPCLTIGLRLPPELFYRFIKSDKGNSEELGLWGRSFVFCHDPQRFAVQPWYPPHSASMASCLPFMERIETLSPSLESQQTLNHPARKVIAMDTYANAHLRDIAYWIKGRMNGEFHDIQHAAGRAAENTLRLAGNFHLVCDGEGPIPREMIERAWPFVEWSLTQYRNVFVYATQPPPKPIRLKPVKPPKLPQHQEKLNNDMLYMLNCLDARSMYSANGKVALGEVALLSGFNSLRFYKTLGWLMTAGVVDVEGSGASGTIRRLQPPVFNVYGALALPSA